MPRLDDIDSTALMEPIFGFDFQTLEFGRLAEVTKKRAPRGHARYYALVHLEDAAALLKQGHAGPAAVLAQSVAEAYFQEAMDALFEAQGHEGILPAVKKAVRDFQLSRKDHLDLYTAMTSDSLTQAPFWARYQAGVDLRNHYVHGTVTDFPADLDPECTQDFILTVVDLIRHVEATLKRSGVKPAPERFQVEWKEASQATPLKARVHLLGDHDQKLEISVSILEEHPEDG